MPKAFPPEFRRDVIAVARKGEVARGAIKTVRSHRDRADHGITHARPFQRRQYSPHVLQLHRFSVERRSDSCL